MLKRHFALLVLVIAGSMNTAMASPLLTITCLELNPDGSQAQDPQTQFQQGSASDSELQDVIHADGLAWEKCSEIRQGMKKMTVDQLQGPTNDVCHPELISMPNIYAHPYHHYKQVLMACGQRMASESGANRIAYEKATHLLGRVLKKLSSPHQISVSKGWLFGWNVSVD